MIEFSNIHKSFGDFTVLAGVSGTFLPGQTSLIIGASGQGKSVLLKCLVGLNKPEQGQVFYNKRDLINGTTEDKKAIRQEIGMLFQGSALFDSKTVEQNVRFPLDVMSNMAKSEKDDRVHLCLQRVGLEKAGSKFPSEISGGMKKRVGIARAIVLQPRYLFCDEPNSGLDPQTSIKIDELIAELTEEYQTTTVVVTHDMNSVVGIGQQIIFLFNGLVAWQGNKDDLLSSQNGSLNDFIFASKVMKQLRSNVTQ